MSTPSSSTTNGVSVGGGYSESHRTPPVAVYVPDRKVFTVLLTVNMVCLVGVTLLLAMVILPGIVELTTSIRANRVELSAQTEKAHARDKVMEESRKRSLQQQAESISRQEQIKLLTERNLKLADELNRKLAQRGTEK